jgi:virulence factor Mce-like protein
MGTGRVISNLVVVGAFAILCIGGLSWLAAGMGAQFPGQSGMNLRAYFASAEGLVPQAEVRVAGVQVGHVIDMSGGPNGTTRVHMQLQSSIRLRRDTRAVVRPKTLLGEKFVELIRSPASTAPYLREGDSIPLSQTGAAVEIDDVLNNMDPQTRKAFSDTLQQLGVALDNRQGDVNASIVPLDQTVTNLRPLAQTAEARQKQIDRILTDLNIIMAALADENQALGQIVDSGNTAMGAIAQRDQDLAGTVDQASILFGSLDTTFRDLTPADRQSLQQSPATIESGRQLFSNANPVVDKLIPELLLAQINYPSNQLNVTDKSALTLAQEWESAFAQKDAAGYSFRFTNINEQPKPGSAPAAPALPKLPGSQLLPSGLDFLLRTPAP